MRPKTFPATRFVLLWMAAAAFARAQSEGTFMAVGNMLTPRASHSATLLQNGKVLIAGGLSDAYASTFLASAELYDPSTRAFTATGSMLAPRGPHRATRLADGRVLITGGIHGPGQPPALDAEIYDPDTGTFSAAGEIITGEGWQTTTLLGNGKVLIAGTRPSAQLYDPSTGRFTFTGPYAGSEIIGLIETADLLADGRVLLTGCTGTCNAGVAQIYDPGTDSFTATGDLQPECGTEACWYRNVNTATLLLNGKTLIVGSDECDSPADAEIFELSTGIFASIGNTAAPHEFATATLLPDGGVLIAGSQSLLGAGDPTAELYDPATRRFVPAGSMTRGRHTHTATLLRDGTVLIAGGFSDWPAATASAEIYRPAFPQASASLLSVSGDGSGPAAMQHAATYQLVSEDNPAVAGEVLIAYCTGLADGGVIPPQVAIGGRMAEVLWFGNTPGFTGLYQINVRVPAGIATGPAVAVRLNYLGRPGNQVTIAVE